MAASQSLFDIEVSEMLTQDTDYVPCYYFSEALVEITFLNYKNSKDLVVES